MAVRSSQFAGCTGENSLRTWVSSMGIGRAAHHPRRPPKARQACTLDSGQWAVGSGACPRLPEWLAVLQEYGTIDYTSAFRSAAPLEPTSGRARTSDGRYSTCTVVDEQTCGQGGVGRSGMGPAGLWDASTVTLDSHEQRPVTLGASRQP